MPPFSNIPRSIEQKIGRQLHCRKDHPLFLVRRIIERRFPDFAAVSAPANPIVTAKKNFDDLLIAKDHPSRGPGDTYYKERLGGPGPGVGSENDLILRTQTTAHETENYWRRRFLLTGDVYRRDEIDRSHYPCFHQMEGVKLWCDGRELGLNEELPEAGDVLVSCGATGGNWG